MRSIDGRQFGPVDLLGFVVVVVVVVGVLVDVAAFLAIVGKGVEIMRRRRGSL